MANYQYRDPHFVIFALALLNTLFLNELVRRLPERPPPFSGPVMSRTSENGKRIYVQNRVHGGKRILGMLGI